MTTDISTNMKIWLTNLYDSAIEQEKGIISNERIWANGATNGEEALQHELNIAEHLAYIDHLNELKEEL